MSPEMVSIIGVGVGLAVLMFGMFGWLRMDMARMEERLRQEIASLRQEMRQEIRGSEQRLITALTNHRHPEPTGEPVFGQPV